MSKFLRNYLRKFLGVKKIVKIFSQIFKQIFGLKKICENFCAIICKKIWACKSLRKYFCKYLCKFLEKKDLCNYLRKNLQKISVNFSMDPTSDHIAMHWWIFSLHARVAESVRSGEGASSIAKIPNIRCFVAELHLSRFTRCQT